MTTTLTMTAFDRARRLTRIAIAFGIAFSTLVGSAAPASADPAGPTNYESVITAMTPAVSGIEAEVVGGDSFIKLRAHDAGEVTVLGYEGEPYLRFGANGVVEENSRSPAVVLNQSRYGTTVGAQSDAKATPEWRVVGTDGEYLWHDHRIHWMVRSAPPQLNGKSTGKVLDWNIPLLVNGQSAQIQGALYRSAPPSMLPYVALGIVGTAGAALAMWRSRLAAAALFLLVSVFALVVSLIEQLSIPVAAGRRVSFIVIPMISALCALVALGRARSVYAFVLKVGCALIMPLWIFLNAKALTNARLPGDVAPAALRAAVVAAAAVVIAFVAIDLPRRTARRRGAQRGTQPKRTTRGLRAARPTSWARPFGTHLRRFACDLIPVGIVVDADTQPAPHPDVRGTEESPRLLIDHLCLHTSGRGTPEGQMVRTMVMVVECRNRLLASNEPRGFTVAQALAHLGQRQADLTEALHRVDCSSTGHRLTLACA